MKKSLFLFLIILLFLIPVKKLYSTECQLDTNVKGLNQNELEDLKTKCQKKLTDLQNQKNTLAAQIQYMDTQIYLANLKIQETEEKIKTTQNEIEILDKRIGGLDNSLTYLSKLLIKRIVVGYKRAPLSLLEIFLDAENADDLVNRIKYAKAAQENNQRLLIQVQNAKLNFEEQKKLREEKVKQLDNLKIVLANQKNDFINQQNAKRKLLEMTKNDEIRYQKLLADAQKELSQILGAAKFLLQSGKSIPVKRGELIGIQGNTGYSFGPHLHFGVYRYPSIDQLANSSWYYSNWLDPSEVLSSKTVNWDTGCEPQQTKTVGGGSFNWPMEPSAISQGSGYTCYSNAYYRGNPHPAWDMWGSTNTPIFSVDEGTAYFCRNCLGDGGNGVFIFHTNGIMTLYWHLQ